MTWPYGCAGLGEAASQYNELYCDQRTVGWAGVMIQLLCYDKGAWLLKELYCNTR